MATKVIRPQSLECTLISAQAEELKVEIIDKVIDDVIDRIEDAAPCITIIEAYTHSQARQRD